MRGICRFRWQSFPLRILIPRVVRITSSQPQGVLGLEVMCRASVYATTNNGSDERSFQAAFGPAGGIPRRVLGWRFSSKPNAASYNGNRDQQAEAAT